MGVADAGSAQRLSPAGQQWLARGKALCWPTDLGFDMVDRKLVCKTLTVRFRWNFGHMVRALLQIRRTIGLHAALRFFLRQVSEATWGHAGQLRVVMEAELVADR